MRLAPVLLLLVSTGCAGLAPSLRHPRSPEAWEGYWLAQHGDELSRPLPSSNAPSSGARASGRVVLLVPGMTIASSMFAAMAARLRRDGYRPTLYEDARLLTDGVEPAAARLAARVEDLVADSHADSIDIVAECVGGVVSRYYVQRLGGEQRVRHLVTFVSPHHGVWDALIPATVTGWQGLRDIERDSAVLRSLDSAPLPPQVEMTSIFSCHDDLILPHDTARVAGARNVEVCDCHHPVDHFSGFWDAGIYGLIAEALAEPERAAVATLSDRASPAAEREAVGAETPRE